jgi:hypothetical protein
MRTEPRNSARNLLARFLLPYCNRLKPSKVLIYLKDTRFTRPLKQSKTNAKAIIFPSMRYYLTLIGKTLQLGSLIGVLSYLFKNIFIGCSTTINSKLGRIG